MSRTPYFYIERYNINTNSWEKQTLYTINKHGETKEVNFWPWNATYDVFGIINNSSNEFPNFESICHMFPVNASPEVVESYSECWDIWHDSNGEEHIFKPEAFYFTLADLLLYIKDYPIVKDCDTMETMWVEQSTTKWEDIPEQTMPNPMSGVATRMINYMEFIDDFYGAFGLKSELRLVGWIL